MPDRSGMSKRTLCVLKMRVQRGVHSRRELYIREITLQLNAAFAAELLSLDNCFAAVWTVLLDLDQFFSAFRAEVGSGCDVTHWTAFHISCAPYPLHVDSLSIL